MRGLAPLRRLPALRLTARHSSTTPLSTLYPSLAHPLPSRPLPTITDYISPTPSHLLNLSLHPHLTPTLPLTRNLPDHPPNTPLPPSHHLVYFPPNLPEPLLLPDGSDAEQSPGPAEWPRRMWAGGSIRWNHTNPLTFNTRAVLREKVETVKTTPDYMFVTFLREMGEAGVMGESGPEGVAVTERRELVFMKPGPKRSAARRVKRVPESKTPEWSISLLPSDHLLFRFSALTFNAHRIHLDEGYCKEVEGHRGLLCHGPLAVVMLCEALQKVGGVEARDMDAVEYRCLAPLVAGERYTVQGREGVRVVEGREERGWEVWILGGEEGEEGLAVRGWVGRRE